MTSTIIKNQIKCNLCDDIIESVHTHDFKWCKCGSIFVDGGKSYLRRGGKELDCFEDLSIVDYRLFKKGDIVLCWGEDKGIVIESQIDKNSNIRIKLDNGNDIDIDSVDENLVELLDEVLAR